MSAISRADLLAKYGRAICPGNKLSKNVYIVAAKRTPFGTYGGTLKSWTATEMGAVASKAALDTHAGLAENVDSVIVGNVAQTDAAGPYLARHVALKAGVADNVPALTVNRLCGSGFQSIVNGCQEILAGDSNVVLTGGAESMSGAPHALYGARFGVPLGQNPELVDTLWEALKDAHIKTPMANTAENLAEAFGVTKAEADEIALMSQQRWASANEAGVFNAEIAPVTIKTRKGEVAFDTDEHARPQSTIEAIAKLPPLFKKDGVVSAGNASGICDGASAVVVASEEAVENLGLKPLARIVSYSVAGVPPSVMGFGPVPSINSALGAAGLSLDDVDMVEINEAFAAQFLSCARGLDLDIEKANLNGGAVALGHPTGASGSRIMGHLAHELQRTGKQFGVGSACIGGGQGIAILLENVA